MATVIDSLIVTLGLNATQFERGADRAERRQTTLENRTRNSTKAMAAGFSAVRNEVLLLAAAFTAGVGIKDFFSSTINNAANLGYLSANLSMSTERISAMQHASERAGGSVDGMTAQLKESVDTLAQLKLGMGPNEGLQWFFRLGGSSSDLKDGNSYLMARSKIIHDMFQVDPGKAALMAKQMGISEDQFNFIKQGPQAIADLTAEMEKNSAVTKEDAENAQKLRKNMLDLRDSLQKTAMQIIFELTPAIQELAVKLKEGADWIAAHRKEIKEWVDGSVAALRTFISTADDLAQSMGGWQNILIGLAAFKAASLVAELFKITAAFVTLGGAISGVAIAKAGLLGAAGAAGYGLGTMLRDALPQDVKDTLDFNIGKLMELFGDKGATHTPVRLKPRSKEDINRSNESEPAAQSKTLMDQSKYAVKKLMEMGWTQPQAAGMVGSLMQESRLDPAAVNPNSGAYGAAQWLSKDRVENFEKWAKRPLQGSTLDQQLGFMNYEMTSGTEKPAGDAIRKASTATEAAELHRKLYERPGETEANDKMRQAFARQIENSIQQSNASAAASIPAGSPSSIANRFDNSKTSTATSETTINGGVNIITQATDPKGIAKEIKPAIEKYNSSMNANTGIR